MTSSEAGSHPPKESFSNKDTFEFTNLSPEEPNQQENVEEWQPTGHEKAIIYTLAFLNLIVSLDATVIVTSLPVRNPSIMSEVMENITS
jgi:hypothetical protein